uniref:Uncharacterized protein AlNc14C3G420 n=1 Tax=Albugo laibachii Nc14 TaxID=890382 RepID=F0VZU1_9STRA|nr:conserved hypothetical protein [Albugo laibachii Nc14]|eukprot:CCA14312.1 conserved hypothetical protein [Albugo laibachii Nc14]
MRTQLTRSRGNNNTTSKTDDAAKLNVKAVKDNNNKEELKGSMDDKVKHYNKSSNVIKKTEISKEGSVPSSKSLTSTKSNTKTLPLPSTRLIKHKQAAVWSTGKRHKTSFGTAYDAGSIPCRIQHGSIRNSLQWMQDISSVGFDPLLFICVEGFQETEHPFVFLARQSYRELLALDCARDKTLPILTKVVTALRRALMTANEDIFLMAVEGIRLLSGVVDVQLNPYLMKIMQQLHSKFHVKQFRASIEETLSSLARNGGKEALAIIRLKIPTFNCIT